MIKLLIVDTVKEFELKQQEIVDILGINCRYSGRYESPDIRLVNGKFGIPFPDLQKHQEMLSDLSWQEVSMNEIIQEES